MKHVRGAQPRTGLILSHDRKVSPRGTFQPSRNRWIAMIPNSFGLPARVTCPGATTFCESCYAMLLDEMLDRYHGEADRRNLTAAERIFRIHWDGDFYSLDYARAWASVIADYPDTQFWAYTRSFTDAVNVVPVLAGITNLTLYLSVDADNADAAHQVATEHDVMLAYCTADYQTGRALAAPGRQAPVPCPENDARKKIPLMTDGVGACVTCQLCPKARRDIMFATSHSEDAAQRVRITRRPSARLIPSQAMASTRDRIIQHLRDRAGTACADYRVDMGSPDDHEHLAHVLHAQPGAVLLSGYHSPLYDSLYGDWDRIEIPTKAHGSNPVSGERSDRTEVVWANYELPRTEQLALLP